MTLNAMLRTDIADLKHLFEIIGIDGAYMGVVFQIAVVILAQCHIETCLVLREDPCSSCMGVEAIHLIMNPLREKDLID